MRVYSGVNNAGGKKNGSNASPSSEIDALHRLRIHNLLRMLPNLLNLLLRRQLLPPHIVSVVIDEPRISVGNTSMVPSEEIVSTVAAGFAHGLKEKLGGTTEVERKGVADVGGDCAGVGVGEGDGWVLGCETLEEGTC